jgi:hypothetical protein
MSIPEKHLEFCRAVAALASAHGVDMFGLSFTPSFDDEWRDKITMNWSQGRHGDDAQKVHVSSTVQVITKLHPLSFNGVSQ